MSSDCSSVDIEEHIAISDVSELSLELEGDGDVLLNVEQILLHMPSCTYVVEHHGHLKNNVWTCGLTCAWRGFDMRFDIWFGM